MITLDDMVNNLDKLSVKERLTLLEKLSGSIKNGILAELSANAAVNDVSMSTNGNVPDDEYRKIAELTGVPYDYVPTEAELRQARLDYMLKRGHRTNNPNEFVPMTPYIWNGQPLSEEDLAQLKVKLLTRNYEPVERARLDARDFSNVPGSAELLGIGKPKGGHTPTDEENKEDYINHLIRKHA
jgi:hypothetical protein